MRLKSVPRVTLGGLALLCAAVSAVTAAPRRPAFPRYSIMQLCELGIGGTRGQVLRDMCIQPEQEALADLRRRWAALPAQALSRCVEQQESLRRTYGGSGSYQGLKTCVDEPIQAVDEVPPTEQRTGTSAPAQRGRRGGTTASPADQINNPPTVGTGIGTGTGLGTSGLGTPGTPGLGTPGTGAGGTGALGTTGTGSGTTGTGMTGTGLGTSGLGTSGTGTTGLGTSGLGTSGGTGSSLGGGTTGSGTAGAGSAGGSGGGGASGGGGGR